jgi:TolB-like protein
MPDPASAEAPSLPSPEKVRLRPWLALAVFAVFVIATLAVALGPHRLATRLLHRNTPSGITALAVIPLDNLSGDPGQEYFADGMTDELITMLAKNSNLRITSRTSVVQYKGVHKPLPQIAQDLGVDGILEGSISRANGQVHMTLQLNTLPLWCGFNQTPPTTSCMPTRATALSSSASASHPPTEA